MGIITHLGANTITAADTFTNLTPGASGGFVAGDILTIGGSAHSELMPRCSAPAATLVVQGVVFDNVAGVLTPVGLTEPLSFTTTGLTDGNGNYLCPRQFLDVGDAYALGFYVVSVSGGAWTLYGYTAN